MHRDDLNESSPDEYRSDPSLQPLDFMEYTEFNDEYKEYKKAYTITEIHDYLAKEGNSYHRNTIRNKLKSSNQIVS